MEEKSGCGYTKQLWGNYRRARKEVKKATIKEEGIEEENSEEDQRAGWY